MYTLTLMLKRFEFDHQIIDFSNHSTLLLTYNDLFPFRMKLCMFGSDDFA